jgi:hypothetical protein
MHKSVFAAVIAAGLMAAPLPVLTQTASAQTDAKKDVKKDAKQKKEPSAGMVAMRERQKKCAAEWKDAKAAGKTNGMKWPQFWSACNKRLKG